MPLALSLNRMPSASSNSSSGGGGSTSPISPSPSPSAASSALLGSPTASCTHAHRHHPRRRTSLPLLSSRGPLARHRWLVFALVALLLLALCSRRTVPLVVLGSTYVLSASLPPPVLGQGDGFDLAHLVPAPGKDEVVPRLIHQVRLGGLAMCPAWAEAQASCVALHPVEDGWTFRLWEDAEGDSFVKSEYPHLFELYRSYEQEIMRSNVLRYLVLHKYGGVYLDLDLRCRVPLDAFLTEDFVTPPAQPIGVNNAFIVAKPNHPFFTYLIKRLPAYHLPWFSSAYVSNMFSTGCHFFSSMHLWSPSRASLKVLPWEYRLNGKVTTPLFEHLGASSWHKGDAKVILELGKTIEAWKPYLPLLALAGAAAVLGALYACVRVRRRGSAARASGKGLGEQQQAAAEEAREKLLA